MGELEAIVLVAVLAVAAVAAIVVVLLLRRCVVRPSPSEALVVTTTSGMQVSFGARLVLPTLQRAERVPLVLVRIDAERRGRESVRTHDGLRLDVVASLFIRVNHTVEDVLHAVRTFGATHVGERETLQTYFGPKLVQALEEVIGRLDADEVIARRHETREHVLEVMGRDLCGFVVEDAMIDRVELVPPEALDPGNALDAKAIRIMTERARDEQIRTAELRTEIDRSLAVIRLQLQETLLELEERQQRMLASAGAKPGDLENIGRRQSELTDRLLELVRTRLATPEHDLTAAREGAPIDR